MLKHFAFLPVLPLVSVGCAQPLPDTVDDSTSDGTSTGEGSTDLTHASEPTDDTSSEPGCGNGIVEAGETCDAAGPSARCDDDCTEVVCGDTSINVAAGEECEDRDLAGATCQALGFDGGMLSCGGECRYDTSGCGDVPGAPELALGFSQVKQFDFSWNGVGGAEHYELLESRAAGERLVQVGEDIVGSSVSHTMPLHFRFDASYVLRACNGFGCSESAPTSVTSAHVGAVGYFKASNTGANDIFGRPLALSDDGTILAVGAYSEGSSAMGIDGDQLDDASLEAGAVYVYIRDAMGQWSQQAYIKASNTGAGDRFGFSVLLSADGTTLAIGATGETSGALGVDGEQADDSSPGAGAVYVFARNPRNQWSQQAYIKASNTGPSDEFGYGVALSVDGSTLAVGAPYEDSAAMGVDGNQTDDSASDAGAVYVFVRDPMNQWSQQAYIKTSNAGPSDLFGNSIALSGDGDTLAVGSRQEDGGATGANGEMDDSTLDAGAVYVFTREAMGQWSQQSYIKASNTGPNDRFGFGITMSDDGDTLAVGAPGEDSGAIGIDGDAGDDSATDAGAVYVFTRDGMGAWSQQAYVKASNTDPSDLFGYGVALSANGEVLAASGYYESSSAIGVGGNQGNSVPNSGAVYVYERGEASHWSQGAYVKASNTGAGDTFGSALALSADGDTLAVGGYQEDGNATGIGGLQDDETAINSGAVYLY